jgi:Cu(I)/Ag(I) efflux system membrane fusion protein
MAFENQGANWLQKDKELRNPYFGDAMLRCGEITQTFFADSGKEG